MDPRLFFALVGCLALAGCTFAKHGVKNAQEADDSEGAQLEDVLKLLKPFDEDDQNHLLKLFFNNMDDEDEHKAPMDDEDDHKAPMDDEGEQHHISYLFGNYMDDEDDHKAPMDDKGEQDHISYLFGNYMDDEDEHKAPMDHEGEQDHISYLFGNYMDDEDEHRAPMDDEDDHEAPRVDVDLVPLKHETKPARGVLPIGQILTDRVLSLTKTVRKIHRSHPRPKSHVEDAAMAEPLLRLGASKNQSYTFGDVKRFDRMLRNVTVFAQSSWMAVSERSWSFSSAATIHCIQVEDLLQTGQNAAYTMSGGGVGVKKVTLNFKSQRGGPIKYRVTVWGQSVRKGRSQH